jgi:hypothetical protein
MVESRLDNFAYKFFVCMFLLIHTTNFSLYVPINYKIGYILKDNFELIYDQ